MNTRFPPQLQSSRAGPNTRCQKCLKFGHFSYNCKSAPVYVARPSRSKQLADAGDLAFPGGASGLYGRNKNMGKPSVEVPDEFKKGPAGVGLADEILKAKEEARRRLSKQDGKSKSKGKESKKSSGKKRSPSSSSDSDSNSHSDSHSDSDSASSRSPPRRTKRRYSSTPPRSRAKPNERETRPRSPSPDRRTRRRSTETPPDRRSMSPPRRTSAGKPRSGAEY